MSKHRVFISYHHGNERSTKSAFVTDFRHAFVDASVRDGEIPDGLKTETVRQKIRDECLRESSVTVVLIGRDTWSRKHVDWEIGSSLRHTEKNPRSGLLGILLPSYPHTPGSYTSNTIPPRLWDNVENEFAKIYEYPESSLSLESWIHTAFLRRFQNPPPNNSRDSFVNNRTGTHWR